MSRATLLVHLRAALAVMAVPKEAMAALVVHLVVSMAVLLLVSMAVLPQDKAVMVHLPAVDPLVVATANRVDILPSKVAILLSKAAMAARHHRDTRWKV